MSESPASKFASVVLTMAVPGRPQPFSTNVCGRWRRDGRIPGVSVGLQAERGGELIAFQPNSGASGTFRVTVQVDGRVVRRAVLPPHTLL